LVLINLHRNLHEKSSFLSEIMFIRINPYLCHLLNSLSINYFPNHKSCVRKKGVPTRPSPLFYPIFYLFLPNIFLNFFITFTPNTIPSKTAIPVLNALIMAFALLVAGSSGAKISCVSPVMISFWSRISCSSMVFFLGDAF